MACVFFNHVYKQPLESLNVSIATEVVLFRVLEI